PRDYDGTITLLVRALELKASSRQVCENLTTVLLNRLAEQFAGDPDGAGRTFEQSMGRLRALDPYGSQEEIQKCLAALADKRTTPFFNRFVKDFEAEDWEPATDMMLWCLRIGPQVNEVRSAASGLFRRLRGRSDGRSQACLRRLEPHVSADLRAEPHEDEAAALLMSLLRAAGVALPGGGSPTLELNRRAVQAANAGRFSEAL